MKRILTLSVLSILYLSIRAQGIDIFQAIEVAQDSALTVYINQHARECEEAAYREFIALRKPQLKLVANEDNYFINQRLDKNYVTNSKYRYLSWGGGLELTQKLLNFGGEFFANTQFWHTYDFGFSASENSPTAKPFYQAYAPISIGYRNSLLGYNAHQWNKRIQESKRQYARQALQNEIYAVAEEAVKLYMNLVVAQSTCDINRRNFIATDSVYQIGKEKFSIAFITQSDLLSLEVSRMNASNALDEALTDERNAEIRLASFLHCDKDQLKSLPLPDCSVLKKMNAEQALVLAEENNPDIALLNTQLNEARADEERTRKQSKLTADVDVSLGYQVVTGLFKANNAGLQGGITISVPLIDHGAARERNASASHNVSEKELGIQESRRTLKSDIDATILTIEEKRVLLEKVEKALNLSEELFNLNVENYSQGLIDLNTFLSSQRHRDDAYKRYVSVLADYWQSYAHLSTLTQTKLY